MAARPAGLALVLALHGGVLYAVWHGHAVRTPEPESTVFVTLISPPAAQPVAAPRPAPPRPAPPRRRQEEPPVAPPVARAPVPSPTQPVAPAVEPVASPLPAETAPAPAAPPMPPGPALLSGELAVNCPDRPAPPYPPQSVRLGEEGRLLLRVDLDERGGVDAARVIESSGYPRLDDAALAAVRRWRCHPAQRDGQAVRAIALQPFKFVLQGR